MALRYNLFCIHWKNGLSFLREKGEGGETVMSRRHRGPDRADNKDNKDSFHSIIVRERRILEIKFSFLFKKFNFLNIEKFANTKISDKAI